jgi:hypothetical protein
VIQSLPKTLAMPSFWPHSWAKVVKHLRPPRRARTRPAPPVVERSAPPLRLDASRPEGAPVTVLAVAGDLDHRTYDQLIEEKETAIAAFPVASLCDYTTPILSAIDQGPLSVEPAVVLSMQA